MLILGKTVWGLDGLALFGRLQALVGDEEMPALLWSASGGGDARLGTRPLQFMRIFAFA